MNDLRRRAFEEARADAAHETRKASSALGRVAVYARSLVALVRIVVALPWSRSENREPIAAGVGRDFRYALRRLRQAPAFSGFTIVSLAIAIGATTAVYAVIHAVMGPPPGVSDPERVVTILHVPYGSGPMIDLSWPDYEDLYERQDVFDHLAAWTWTPASHVVNGVSGSSISEWVTGDYFDVVGARAAMGRTLDVRDDNPSAPPVAVIGHRFWRLAFAGSDRVLGEAVRVNGIDYHIVGVVEEGFRGLFNGGLVQTSVWLPMGAAHNDPGFARRGDFGPESRNRRWVGVRGRLALHQTFEQAVAQVTAIARQLDGQFPLVSESDPRPRSGYGANRNAWSVKSIVGLRVLGVPDEMAQRFASALLVAVGLVLLVAATNLANLATARTTRRRQELSVRRALGASRIRLVREALVESLLLAVSGGTLGLLVSWALMRVFSTELRIGFAAIQFDPRFGSAVLLCTIGATSLVLIVAGFVPALMSTRAIRSTLASENVTTAGRWRGRRYLIALQVTVSAALVVLASVFVTHARRQAAIDTGIDLERLALAEIDFGSQRYDEPQVRRITNDVLARLRRPDVESAIVSSGLPVSLRAPSASVKVDTSFARVRVLSTTRGFDRTLGLSLVHGRVLDERDVSGPPAVVLDEATATKLFGSAPNAVGRQTTLERQGSVGEPKVPSRTFTIVGVVADTDVGSPGFRNDGVAYLPFDQHYESRLVIAARTSGDPALFVNELRRTIAEVDPHLAIEQIGTGAALAGPDSRFSQIVAGVTGLLGAFALVLALAGLYGVMSHLVAARTREVGVRIALGATAARVQQMVIREGLSPVILGLVAGLGLAIFAGVGARSTLRHLELQLDVVWLALLSLLFLAAGVLACYMPARRAARIEPARVLKG